MSRFDDPKKRLFILILFMSIIVMTSVSIIGGMLYYSAIEGQKKRVLEFARSQRTLIQSIYRAYESGGVDDPISKTLLRLDESYQLFHNENSDIEIVFAYKEDKKVYFLHLHQEKEKSLKGIKKFGLNVVKISDFYRPPKSAIEHALAKEEGVKVCDDCLSSAVIAAYLPVKLQNVSFGMVAKVSMEKIREPFVYTVLLSLAVALIMIIFGAFLFLRLINPLIRELKEGIKQRIKAQEELKTTYDAAVDGIVVFDQECHMMTVNLAMEKIFGYTKHELIGKKLKQLFSSLNERDESPLFLETMLAKENIELSTFKKDRAPIIVSLNVGKVVFEESAHYIAVIRDITHRKALEFQLNEKSEQLVSVISNIPGAVYRKQFSSFPRYTFMSAAVKELTGYESEYFIDQSDNRYYKLYYDEKLLTEHKSIKRSNPYTLEYRIRKKDGNVIWVSESITLIFDDNDKIEWIDGVIFDITKNKQYEIELENQVKKAVDEIKEKDAALLKHSRMAAMGEMISIIAHQWRQPITGIGMTVNNMSLDIDLDMYDPQNFKKNLEVIDDQIKFLSQTIDDFRSFFRPNKEKSTTTVKELFEQTFKVIEKSVVSKGITLETEFNERVDLFVYKNELVQVFLNIIKNAQDALIEKEVENKSIKIDSSENETGVIIHISDNAGGIPEEIRTKIFEPYFSTKDEKHGTGLGLYMAKSVVEDHMEGKITAHNSQEGAVFTIELSKKGSQE